MLISVINYSNKLEASGKKIQISNHQQSRGMPCMEEILQWRPKRYPRVGPLRDKNIIKCSKCGKYEHGK